MTLNLMLTSRSAAYLSGDFRLSRLDRHGRPTGWVTDDPRSQKLIPVIRRGWSALVTFTGVAVTPQGQSVGDWIAEQTQAIPMAAYFGELPTALLAADGWLAGVIGYRELTFSVVAFVGRRPYAMLVSNREDLDGHT